MRPSIKRTIITSKGTGRRYFLVRSTARPGGRRYYVCSQSDCEARLTREADRYCRAHIQHDTAENKGTGDISPKSDDVDDDVLNDNSEIIDEETPTKAQRNSKFEANDDDQQDDDEDDDSSAADDVDEISSNDNTSPQSLPPPSHKLSKANRQIDVNESNGSRSFRDNSGRRRYLCQEASCTKMLKRQTDLFCRRHDPTQENVDDSKPNSRVQKRHSAPPAPKQSKSNYRSPFSTPSPTTVTAATVDNSVTENQSDEYEIPHKKIPERTGTHRSFRDASGKIRFLCANSSCTSRVPKQADTYCRRHKLELQTQEAEGITHLVATDDKINHNKDGDNVEEMDVNHNNTDKLTEQQPSESPIKKRKQESLSSISKSTNLSSIPVDKIVIATTTLLDYQWVDVLTFLRQFPQVQFSTNLNVNNSTTHLLVDDSENHLHCTITKKIVQAAVRRHIFIISSRWINDCVNLNKFLDEHPYEIISDSHTTLRLSTQTHQYLFNSLSLKSSYAFSIECRQCQGSINRNELLELIELTGAKLYDNQHPVDILIVLCDTNEKNINKIKEKYLQTTTSNIKYVTSDFLLKSIIKFEIQDIDKYSL